MTGSQLSMLIFLIIHDQSTMESERDWEFRKALIVPEFHQIPEWNDCRTGTPDAPGEVRRYDREEELGRLRVAAHNLGEPMAVRPRVFQFTNSGDATQPSRMKWPLQGCRLGGIPEGALSCFCVRV